MNHGQNKIQLSRERNVRNALIRTMAVSLVRDNKIKTTEAKAKVLKPYVERLITKAKKGTLESKRFIRAKLGESTEKILVNTIAQKYKDRNGGYLRITKLSDRKNDGAKCVQIEFV